MSLIRNSLSALLVIGVSLLMTITCIDVVGRYFLNTPLRGSGEMIGLALGLSISSALPLVADRDEHVSISLIANLFGKRFQVFRYRIVSAVCGLISLYLAAQLVHRGLYLLDTGEYTTNLKIKLWPTAFVMAAFWAISATPFLLRLFVGRPLPVKEEEQRI